MYKIEWKKEIPLLAWMVIILIITALVYDKLPDIIPIHWNINGDIDGYGSKLSHSIMFPALLAGVYFLTILVPFLDPMKERYEHFLGVYRFIRTSILFILSIIYLMTLGSALGYAISVPKVMAVTIGLLFTLLGNVLGKVKQNYFVGFRLPWTLADEDNWNKTHRVAGKAMVLAGLMTMSTAFLTPAMSFSVMMASLLIATIVPGYYSYSLYKKSYGKTKKKD